MMIIVVDIEGFMEEVGDEWKIVFLNDIIIGYIYLYVSDLNEVKVFYKDVLGFDIVGNYVGMFVFFVLVGGYYYYIGLNIWVGRNVLFKLINVSGLDYYMVVLFY